jgi:REP element-mobilizing transposase RayT
MSSKYKFKDQEKIYFVTFTVVYWIDVFIRTEYKDILLDAVRFNQVNKGLEVYAWCLMTSHMHMILGTQGEKLERIMQGVKSVSSRKIGEAINQNRQESRKGWMLGMFKNAGELNKHNGQYQF